MSKKIIGTNLSHEETTEMFYRLNEHGNAVILDSDNGLNITQLNIAAWPIDSEIDPRLTLSTEYNHPEGIVLSVEDAEKLGITHE
jgi:hypothetical protein